MITTRGLTISCSTSEPPTVVGFAKKPVKKKTKKPAKVSAAQCGAKRKSRDRADGSSGTSDEDSDEEPVLTLGQALKVCEDCSFLSDWDPREKSIVKVEAGSAATHEFEKNVFSEISSKRANFRLAPA
jgi:hypothetical protein